MIGDHLLQRQSLVRGSLNSEGAIEKLDVFRVRFHEDTGHPCAVSLRSGRRRPRMRAGKHDGLPAADGPGARTRGEAVDGDHLDIFPVYAEVIRQQIGRERVLSLVLPRESLLRR